MEVRSTIQIGMAEGKTAKIIYADILLLYGNCMTIQQVTNWRQGFFSGKNEFSRQISFFVTVQKKISLMDYNVPFNTIPNVETPKVIMSKYNKSQNKSVYKVL